jgi:hypothetical protein
MSHDAHHNLSIRARDRFNILLRYWISTDGHVCLINFIVSEVSNEVAISFEDLAVDDVDFIGVDPLFETFLT